MIVLYLVLRIVFSVFRKMSYMGSPYSPNAYMQDDFDFDDDRFDDEDDRENEDPQDESDEGLYEIS